MTAIKNGKPLTLKDLITEKAGGTEERNDPDYAEKEATPVGTVPEFYAKINDRMKELEVVENRLRRKAKVKSNPVMNYLSSTYGRAMQLIESDYQATSVDDLVNEQINIMDSLNKDVRQAVNHSRAESGNLQDYADKVMADFEKAKKGMQDSDRDYNNLQHTIRYFESQLLDINMADDNYTTTRKSYDDAKRGLQKAQNMREEYAVQIKVRLAQRKTALTKEEIVRTVLYELQKMDDHLDMFLEEVQQTSDATALSQYAYQTAEALRDSYRTLSGISESRSIMSRTNIGRMMSAINDTNYDFPQETLKAEIEQDRELKAARSVSAFREVNDLLSRPAFEEDRDLGADNRNGYSRHSVDLLETLGGPSL